MRILRMGTGEDGSGERSSTLFVTMSKRTATKSTAVLQTAPYLTLRFLPFLFITGCVGLQRVAAAVERVVSILVIQDARKADLPLIAVATELRVQAQTAAVQVLKTGYSLPRVK